MVWTAAPFIISSINSSHSCNEDVKILLQTQPTNEQPTSFYTSFCTENAPLKHFFLALNEKQLRSLMLCSQRTLKLSEVVSTNQTRLLMI